MTILPSDIPISNEPKWKSLYFSHGITIILEFDTNEARTDWFTFHLLQANPALCKGEKEQKFLNKLQGPKE